MKIEKFCTWIKRRREEKSGKENSVWFRLTECSSIEFRCKIIIQSFMGHNKTQGYLDRCHFSGKWSNDFLSTNSKLYFQTHNLFFLFPYFSFVLRFVLPDPMAFLFIFSYIFLSTDQQTNTHIPQWYKLNHLLKLFHFIPMCVEFSFFFFFCVTFFRSFFFRIDAPFHFGFSTIN